MSESTSSIQQSVSHDANEDAFKRAASGQLQIIELLGAAQQLSQAGLGDRAVLLYRLWIKSTPSPLSYAARYNLAVLLSERDDQSGAEAEYRAAVTQNPKFSEAWINLGILLERMKRPDEALASWLQVVDFATPVNEREQVHLLHALNNLGRLFEIQKNFPDAEEMFKRSLNIDPSQKEVITHWVHLRQMQCKWPVISGSEIGITDEEIIKATSAFTMVGASGDPAHQLAASCRFVEENVMPRVHTLTSKKGYRHEILRIGYLSSDFCSQSVSILIAELYGLHDRSRVEVFGFSWSEEDGSPIRALAISGMDHHIHIGGISDDQAAHRIRSYEIDILVDLHGLTFGTRPDILMYRPAPVQISWFGLPASTALPEIDYVIADPFVLPPNMEHYFTATPLHMPHTFQFNGRKRTIGEIPTRAACGLPENAFVFCAFNSNFKITPEVFGTWMRILKRVPGSVLWMKADNGQVRTNLSRTAELAGVDQTRLIFAERMLTGKYLARYRAADLFLDTVPFNGSTTASDALWTGLPVLTCAGRTFSSRMVGSLLRAVDMTELITYDMIQYEEKAISIGNNRALAQRMRQHLDDSRMTCPLFDSAQFVRDLEDRYEQIAVKERNSEASSQPTLGGRLSNSALPLVSILIPTHNRPDYGELALQSALSQTWQNIEIVVSDNSDNDLTAERFAPYVAQYPFIRYVRVPGLKALDNFLNCYKLAQGEFINFLMDDDLFHPTKIERMMSYILAQPNLGLVTSFRQLIDAEGEFMAPLSGTERLFDAATKVSGTSLGDRVLTNGQNLIGEPTTALFRKSALTGQFGMFLGRQYSTLSDIASWLAVMATMDCVYLPEALSYFRIHIGQDQRHSSVKIQANVEWLQLLCDAHEHGVFLRDRALIRELLTSKLVTCIWFLSGVAEEVPAAYELKKIYSLVGQATEILLRPDLEVAKHQIVQQEKVT